jgi:hypothetical protein
VGARGAQPLQDLQPLVVGEGAQQLDVVDHRSSMPVS